MTPRLRQAQGAQGGDGVLNGEDHPFVHRATTAAAAPTGANGPTTGNTGICTETAPLCLVCVEKPPGGEFRGVALFECGRERREAQVP